MNKIFCFLILLLINMISVSFAETQIITLKDGSQIKGELISVNSGSYTVRTPTLGDIKVDSSQVASISNPSIAPVVTTPRAHQDTSETNTDQRIQAAQNKLMSDPEMMAQIQDMIQDPDTVKLLTDPELAKAAMSRDVNAIQNNPKAKELMNNPKIRALIEKMQSKE